MLGDAIDRGQAVVFAIWLQTMRPTATLVSLPSGTVTGKIGQILSLYQFHADH